MPAVSVQDAVASTTLPAMLLRRKFRQKILDPGLILWKTDRTWELSMHMPFNDPEFLHWYLEEYTPIAGGWQY
jgi:hypothetical protein